MKKAEEAELLANIAELRVEVDKTRQQLNLVIEMLSYIWKNQYGNPTARNEKSRKQIDDFIKQEIEKIEVLGG